MGVLSRRSPFKARLLGGTSNIKKYAPHFDGLTQYARLESRAIDPDADIPIDFWTPTSGGVKTIIYQGSGVSNLTDNDIWLLRNGDNIEFRCCGANRSLGALPDGKKFRLTLIGTNLTLKDSNDVIINSWVFNRGAYRSVNPVTLVGARLSGASYVNLFEGKIPNININNLYYAMDKVGQSVQPSAPPGNDLTIINHTNAMWVEV
ncbi:hypothetical protein SNE85_000835 [Vibrio cholerae]|nr:hypothetical protein [Vibrio cholerae]